MRTVHWLFLLLILSQTWAEPAEDLLQKAQGFLRAGEKQSAIDTCEEALNLNPQNPDTVLHLGKILIDAGQTKRGLECMDQIARVHPSQKRHIVVGEAAIQLEQWQTAEFHFNAALKLQPTIEIHQSLAWIYEELGKGEQSLQHRSKAVALKMPQIRGLPFKTPVTMQSQSKAQLAQFLLQDMQKELPDEKANAIEIALKAFGLVPESFSLKPTMLRLLTEQIGGFYNPETKKLYLIAEGPRARGPLEKLMGQPRDDAQERLVIAHEMTHALQDQHYNLLGLDKKVKQNDDWSLAYQALLEGDAMLGMLDYQYFPKRLDKDDAFALRMTMSLMKFFMPFMEQQLSQVPAVIRESLLFPYTDGLYFCLEFRTSENPWTNINRCYKRLPRSTEHILHPEKYLAKEPVWDCRIPDFSSLLGDKWQEKMNNVMGEFTCRIVFSAYNIAGHASLAQGWAGDRYSVLQNEAGQRALIWLTKWDTLQDAKEFFDGYHQLLLKKYPGMTWKAQESYVEGKNPTFAVVLVRHRDRVCVLEQIPENLIATLRQKVMQIQFTKMR